MKCDLHAHSNASDAVLRQAFTMLCGVRECYSEPEDIYRIEKGLDEKYKVEPRMDLVTITDHITRLESARATFYLARKYPKECFTGGEFMMRGSEEGHMIELLCYDFNETQFRELFRRSNVGMEAFTEYADKQNLQCIPAHIPWPVVMKPKLNAEQVYKWAMRFNIFEIINGDLERSNDISILLAKAKGLKPIDNSGRKFWGTTGGSDAHLLSGLGRAYTVAPKARNKKEFLEALRAGEVYGEGEYSNLAFFNEQIHEGISAYIRYEWQEIKRMGVRDYAIKYPNKLVYISLIPLFRPILPLAIATNLKTGLEERSCDLEDKVEKHILKQEFEAEKMETYNRIKARKAELKAGRKEAGYYLPLPNGIRARLVERLRKSWKLADTESEFREQSGEGETSAAQFLAPFARMAESALQKFKIEQVVKMLTGGNK